MKLTIDNYQLLGTLHIHYTGLKLIKIKNNTTASVGC